MLKSILKYLGLVIVALLFALLFLWSTTSFILWSVEEQNVPYNNFCQERGFDGFRYYHYTGMMCYKEIGNYVEIREFITVNDKQLFIESCNNSQLAQEPTISGLKEKEVSE